MLSDENMFHLHCKKGQVGRYAILPGDPGRCEQIAALLEGSKFLSQNREFTIFTGSLEGETVSVCSTGIGGPSAAIAVEELFQCGADTFVRVGTCGGISREVDGGDLIVATGAVRQEGTALQYAPAEFPAVPDYAVLSALVEAAEKSGVPTHTGVVQSKDSFYGQHSPGRMPVSGELLAKWEAWKRLGVLAREMEAATIFTVSAALGARAGAVFLALWNQERRDAGLPMKETRDTGIAVRAAVEAVRLLILRDRSKREV